MRDEELSDAMTSRVGHLIDLGFTFFQGFGGDRGVDGVQHLVH